MRTVGILKVLRLTALKGLLNMNIIKLLKIKEQRLFNLERKCARLQGEIEYIKIKQAENCQTIEEDVPFEDDFINDERLAQC